MSRTKSGTALEGTDNINVTKDCSESRLFPHNDIAGLSSSVRETKEKDRITGRRVSSRNKSQKEVPPDSDIGGSSRESRARHFKVANVGNNGMIYLRPVQQTRQHQFPAMSTFTFPDPTESHKYEGASGPTNHADYMKSNLVAGQPTTRPKRSYSHTALGQRPDVEQLGSGSLKIVIDRPDTAPQPEDLESKDALPSLEVPIPNYRLGTPRFSARGTAFLHQSIYTHTSFSGEQGDPDSSVMGGSEYDTMFPRQSGIEAHAVLSRRHSHASPQPYSIQSFGPPSYAQNHEGTNGPGYISPHIFDELSAAPHDASIVKYSPINGDIIAATPARIIIQITSERFLDYELLSDFFLTVRAYLSTHELLGLLLARFEWAINRFDDNGRVIRVRTFAALRHWILNYFSYDFVMDRELRVKFCDRINALTKFVKSRPAYGPSDVKLISDLKKCWNGRCSLFWDSLPIQGHQDLDIQPGGIVGSRDSQLVHQSQLRVQPVAPQLGLNPAQLTTGATSIANWYQAVMEHSSRQAYGHARNASTGTSRSLPISPSSDNGAPVLSCSIPAKGFKRGYGPYANKALGIHPIPTSAAGKRVCPAAPSSLSNEPARPVQEHRRSGSFSDAARDRREPLSSDVAGGVEEFAQNALLSERSLLRGHAIPPGGPYVSAVASRGPGEATQRSLRAPGDNAGEQVPGRSSSNNPNVKSFIGNIKRALSSRHAGNKAPTTHSMAGASTAPALLSSLGKSASVPLNVMFQATSSGQLASYRSVRVDLLAAEVYDSFRQATVGQDGTHPQSVVGEQMLDHLQALASDQGQEDSHGHNPIESNGGLRPPELRRLNSAMTDSSQSILIVDDTGLNMPPIQRLDTGIAHGQHSVELTSKTKEPDLTQSLNPDATQEELVQTGAGARNILYTEASHNTEPEQRAKTPGTQQRLAESVFYQNQPSLLSSTLRRYASYQSTLAMKGVSTGLEIPKRASTTAPNRNQVSARMLRRRPGGDLRANQNVQDLEMATRPASAGSITTYSESVRNSEIMGFGERITRTFNPRKSSRAKVDLPADTGEILEPKKHTVIRSHSSEPPVKRRPSFEAAIARFANIPDDDEGGIEATLLKLEGRYVSPLQSPVPQNLSDGAHSDLTGQITPLANSPINEEPNRSSRGFQDEFPKNASREDGDEGHITREQLVSTLYAVSDDSYNSVPLLAREESVQQEDENSTHWWTDGKVERESSGELVQETPSMRRLRHGSVAPTATTDSFLLDENDEFMSDTSSELSLDTIEADQEHYSDRDSSGNLTESIIVGHQHPPSPPMTADNEENDDSYAAATEQIHRAEKPPTPDPSPVSHHAEPSKAGPKQPTKVPAHPRHMPFILGCDSELLAQQLTLVEQDALKEVDWRDLVDMRWQNTATSTTNWVEYLRTQDPLGIDLVTARFNIMVKWTLSEIVLTDNVEERALTIMRYIHIAQKARQLSNYATLLQLTIALTSADCTRLSKTWDLVPEKEKEILQDLEMLVSPRRNFQNLRLEMEKANADEGCIPVVALYIHDLTYNAQKPPLVPGGNNGEALVNFERYRSSAVIVKNLLRLIDASTKYNFQPVEGVIERCLWMACLTDEMIAHTSKQQEYGGA